MFHRPRSCAMTNLRKLLRGSTTRVGAFTARWGPSHSSFKGERSLPLLAPGPIRMMGVPIAPLSEDEVVAVALAGVRDGRGGWICPVNLDVLRHAVRDPAQRALVDRADLRTADGMPLVWASRLQRTPL